MRVVLIPVLFHHTETTFSIIGWLKVLIIETDLTDSCRCLK